MIVDCPKNPFLLPGLGHHGQYDTGNNVNQWDNSGHGKRSLYRSHSEAGGHPWQSDQDTWQEKDPVSRMVRATDTVDRQLLEYLARDETTNSALCQAQSVNHTSNNWQNSNQVQVGRGSWCSFCRARCDSRVTCPGTGVDTRYRQAQDVLSENVSKIQFCNLVRNI